MALIKFRKDLQVLRAVAVMIVIAAHSELGVLDGGFVGVDIFFVLSGFLITGLLFAEFKKNQRISLQRFYARRFKRLLPALILVVMVSLVAAVLLLSRSEVLNQSASSPYTLLWISNIYFAFSQTAYFDELASKDLFLHTWSLGVEEQFYLLWPLFLLLLFRYKFFFAKREASVGPVIVGIGLVSVCSFGLSLYWSYHYPDFGFYLMPSRIWQFGLGALVYLLFARERSENITELAYIFSKYRAYLWFLGFALIFASAATLDDRRVYPGFWALFPSVGAALVIASGCFNRASQTSVFVHPILIRIGDYSYSLYLWHWPLFIIAFSLGYEGNVYVTMGVIALAFAFSVVTYHFIEQPFWKGRWSHAQPRLVILASITAAGLGIAAVNHGLPVVMPKPVATSASMAQWRGDVPEIYGLGCDRWFSTAELTPCVFAGESASHKVVVLGDSIALQWFSAVPVAFPLEDWQIHVYTKSACAMVDEDFFYQRIGQVYEVCSQWRDRALEAITELKPDVVIVGNSVQYDFTEKQWVEGSSRVLKRLSESAREVYLLLGTPGLGFDGLGCLERNMTDEGQVDVLACQSRDRLSKIENAANYLTRSVDRFKNVHWLDLNDLVCPDGICQAMSSDGVVTFRDSQHLTDTFVRHHAMTVRERVRSLSELP